MENFGFNQGSIARRLLLQMVVISLLTSAVICALQIHFRYREKLRSIDEDLLRVGSSHRQNLALQLMHFDEKLLRAELQGIMDVPNIQFVEVRSAAGQRIALGVPGTEDYSQRQISLSNTPNGTATELGSLTIQANLQLLQKELKTEAAAIFLWDAGGTLVISLLIFFLFEFTVTRHLRDLTQQALAMDLEQPDYPFHLNRPPQKKKSADELDFLTDSLNGLFKNLRATIENLRHTNDRLDLEIEERKKAEEALKFTQFAVDRTSEQAFWTTEDGHFIYVNDAACHTLGYTRDELLQLSVHHIDPRFSPELFAGHWLDLQKKTSATFETVHQTRNGRIYPVEVCANFVVFDGRKYNCAFARDLTERKNIENKLLESHNRLREVIETIPIRVFWKDCNGRYLGCNGLFARDAGRSHPDNVVGTDDFSMAWADQAELYRADDRAVIESGIGKIHFEEMQTSADGRLLWLRTTKIPLRDGAGNIYGLFGTYEDITESKRAQEVLKSSLAEKESLLKEVHHRVKNNLQLISSLLNLQGRKVQNPEAHEFLRDTQNRVRSMALLHETLYRSGDFSQISFPKYVKGICAHLARSYAGNAEGIHLRQDIANVSLDMDQAIPAGLIISELVANTYKHAFPARSEGEISVKLQKVDEHNLILRVSDNGVGFAQSTLSEGSETLGLTLVRSLSRQLDGQLSIKSEQGSVFEIVFPAQAL